MDKATLKALKGSIRKWEKIVDGTGKDEGEKNCPLCKMFNVTGLEGRPCDGCPVRDAVGVRFCARTPYARWTEEHNFGPIPRMVETPGQKEAALAELAFLKSLLPKGTK